MDQVKQMIIACIISCKGGVPVTEIDNEYQQLVGMKIPYAKYGFLSLEDFIQSITEVMMVQNPDGSVILKARDSKTSHIASLVNGQRTGNARKKVTNRYRTSAAGQNYMHGASSNWNYGNNRGNNYSKMERIIPERHTQGVYKAAERRKQETGQLHTVQAESLFKHPTENGMTQGIKTHAEEYSLKSAHKENELHHSQKKLPLKMNDYHFLQKNSTDRIRAFNDSHEEFNRSQVKVKNQRRISVDDTILVTIINNYYRSSSNEDCSRHRRSLLSDWRIGEEEREIQQDQLCRCSKHHQGYSKDFSTLRQKYTTKPSRVGEPVDYYEEEKEEKWSDDCVNDCAEDVSGYYIREDSGYTHYKRDVSRKKPGLLIKVKNEYAIDRRI